MASIYKPKDKENWYISFIDPATGRTRNISTKLKATKQNYKKAEEYREKIEDYVAKKKKEYEGLLFRKKTIKEAFEHFKKINSDKNPKTLSGYDHFYNKYSELIDVNRPVTIINKTLIEDWLIKIKQVDRSKNTIYNYYKVLRKFLSFLFEYEYIPVFIINKNVKPRQENKKIITFTEENEKTIIEALDEKKELKTKNEIVDVKNSNFRTMIYLLSYTGLRPTDILNITVEDIDLEKLQLSYYSQKTNEYFTVPFQEILKSVLQKRIEEIKTGRIFNYATEGEMSKAFRRYLTAIKLDGKGYNLRTFRKTFATKAFEKDIALVSTAALLGHKNISTTMKYYTKASRKKLAEELKKLKK